MFDDRRDAGQQLGLRLSGYAGREDVVVVGLPRGGVPVAREVATLLGLPLDVIVVRKLGVPSQPELAMGAIGETGVRYVDQDIVTRAGVTPAQLDSVERRERRELDLRVQRFREGGQPTSLEGRVVIVVDDGIATGATARAACQVARSAGAERIVLSSPVAPSGWSERLRGVADDFVAVTTPSSFSAVGYFYRDFGQVADADVVNCLRSVAAQRTAQRGIRDTELPSRQTRHDHIRIDVGNGIVLGGLLDVPADPIGLVLFAHGSGSSRHSPRNRHVAATLNRASIATFLFDLLADQEASVHDRVFDVELLSKRLLDATEVVRAQPRMNEIPFGYFGASTGAGAALLAAAQPRSDVAAIVARGGRPDLAASALSLVAAPTLLIVGGLDGDVIELNRRARALLLGRSAMTVVPGASHLFEEPGTLEAVASLATEWFTDHFDGH